MHLGRSHHLSTEIIVSAIGGFAASFLTFTVMTVTQHQGSIRGQLVPGDQAVNREFPTTLNMMHAALDGSNPMANAMTSYAWWVTVVMGGIAASFLIFKLARRYV